MNARDELSRIIASQHTSAAVDAILAAGYRKTALVTEFGTIFNRAAVFLNPPAESMEEFKERYESEFGWILSEHDKILTRTFLRCDPEPSDPVLHAGIAR